MSIASYLPNWVVVVDTYAKSSDFGHEILVCVAKSEKSLPRSRSIPAHANTTPARPDHEKFGLSLHISDNSYLIKRKSISRFGRVLRNMMMG